jgi:hypothetical protein
MSYQQLEIDYLVTGQHENAAGVVAPSQLERTANFNGTGHSMAAFTVRKRILAHHI